MKRQEIVELIIANSQARSELTRFGGWVTPFHPIIIKVREKTGVHLKTRDISGKTVGKIADTVVARLPITGKK